uniref:Shootin-1 n=1 Tax=Trichogramma kaykai TaxID=54128 RepID=A0ABD2W8B8_9HYME
MSVLSFYHPCLYPPTNSNGLWRPSTTIKTRWKRNSSKKIEDESDDPWFHEMKEISLRKEMLLQSQLEIAAENQRLLQEMIAEQRQLRVSQEAAQSSLAKLQKDQAEATQKLLKISGTLEVLLLESRQHQADKEDEGVSFEKSKLLSSTRTTESEENNINIREINESLQTLLNPLQKFPIGSREIPTGVL